MDRRAFGTSECGQGESAVDCAWEAGRDGIQFGMLSWFLTSSPPASQFQASHSVTTPFFLAYSANTKIQ